LALVMLILLVGVMFTGLVVTMVISQSQSTNFSTSRVPALDAAQAGIDVALGEIRSATDNTGVGLSTGLPCTTTVGGAAAPIVGTVNPGSAAAYSVSITYYTADPVQVPTTQPMACVPGYGTYLTGTSTPSYAVITSTGTPGATTSGSTSSRTITTTYKFTTSNQNILGGLIHEFITSGQTDVCMTAGTGTNLAGTGVTMQACSQGSSQQTFAYTTDLTVVLVASKTTANPNGMCLANVTNGPLFQACASPVTAQQQWSFNYNQGLQGTIDGATATGPCMNIAQPYTIGSPVGLIGTSGEGCSGANLAGVRLTLDTTVGAGKAGVATGQVIDFGKFGSCFDFYASRLDQPLDLGTCKQEPNGSVDWNQVYTLPAPAGQTTGSVTGKIKLTVPVGNVNGQTPGTYCMPIPSVAPGSYIFLTSCSAANTTWIQNLNTGIYATSWTITDPTGTNCLEPDLTHPIPSQYPISSFGFPLLIVAPCDQSAYQKWDAPPNIAGSALQNTNEK
jgi:hypothetical protein